jgi:glycosyltransferase involved in cell wall biosynthesis
VLTAVIPCRNEEASIGPVIVGLRGWVDSIIVVNDQSKDATGSAARSAGALVLDIQTSSGKGAAMRCGWDAAARLGATRLLLLDGDGQHDPDDAPRFIRHQETTGADLVIGNRFTGDTGSMPRIRRWTNRWMSRRLSQLCQMPLPDSQCGYRLVNLAALLRLNLKPDHFEIESEMCFAFARAGHRIEFLPIKPRYEGQHSKIRPLRDAVRWFRWYQSALRCRP